MTKKLREWRWLVAFFSLLPLLWCWTAASALMTAASDLAVGVGFVMFGLVVGAYFSFLQWLFATPTKEKADAKQ